MTTNKRHELKEFIQCNVGSGNDVPSHVLDVDVSRLSLHSVYQIDEALVCVSVCVFPCGCV